MRKTILLLLLLVLALALVAVGCGDDEEGATTTVAAGEAVLTVAGQGFTMAELEALGVETLNLENPRSGPADYTGVRLGTVLAAAGLSESAATLTFVASDGYEFEAPLADVLACIDCLLAFDDDGTLRTAMPGMENKAWVKDVVEIVAS